VKQNNTRSTIYFFTLSFDESHELLSHVVLWVKYLSKKFERVVVISPKINIGNADTSNLEFRTLGGGSIKFRILAIFRVLKILFEIIPRHRESIVFYHMITYPAIVLSPILRMFNVKQGLWYSHQYADFGLRVAVKFVDNCFSTMKSSFPARSRKFLGIGHGIVSSTNFKSNTAREKILVLGRVSKVKRIEDLLIALERYSMQPEAVDIWGPVVDSEYCTWLQNIAKELSINIEFKGTLSPKNRDVIISKYHAVYSGTLGSVDKAPLEAAANGCFVLAINPDVISQSGMSRIYEKNTAKGYQDISLEKQLLLCSEMRSNETFREELAQLCQNNNDLRGVIDRIYTEMQK